MSMLSPRRTLLAAALLLPALATAASAHEFKAGQIEIEHPWSRATPPGARTGAGYLVLENDGPADRLVAATAEVAGRTEIHQMTMTDGVMRMRAQPEGVELPADGEVAFEPGSYHLMFFDLKQPIREGERFKGTLTFEKAGTVDIEFAVEKAGAKKTDNNQGGHAAHGAASP
jgi:copper(I)-binding protein